MFRVLPRVAAVLLVSGLAAAAPAAAQDVVASNAITHAVLFPVAPLAGVATPARAAEPAEQAVSRPQGPTLVNASIGRRGFEQRRPLLLPALYVSQVALQALDAHSTFTALDRGAHEVNPVMKGVVGNRGAMMAVKAGVAAGTIWASERMWRRGNRAGAIALMIIANGVTAAVVAHNYRVAGSLR